MKYRGIRDDFGQGQRFFSCSQNTEQLWGPSSILSSRYQGFFLRIMRIWREADSTLPCSTETKNTCCCTPASPYVFVACTGSSVLLVFRRVRKLQEATINFAMPVCSSVHPFTWNNSAPTGRIFIKFDIRVLFENLWKKFQFQLNLTKITCPLHEDICRFVIISR